MRHVQAQDENEGAFWEAHGEILGMHESPFSEEIPIPMSQAQDDRIAAARLKKATALAIKLRAAKITATEVLDIELDFWPKLAKVCGVNPPSADTQKLVVKLLADWAANDSDKDVPW